MASLHRTPFVRQLADSLYGSRLANFNKLQRTVEKQSILVGRQDSTQIEPILDSLYNLLLNYQLLRRKLTNLDQLVSDLIKPERVMKMDFLL